MKKQTLPLLFMLLLGSLHAQNQRDAGRFGEIYRLTGPEARAILVDNAPFDSTWLHTFLGFDDTLPRHRLPPGHYLYVYAYQEQVSASIFTNYAFEVNLLTTRRDLAFVVTDHSGKRIRDARATLNGRKIHFDEKMQCYRLAKRKNGGVLEVQALGQTCFYQISKTPYYHMHVAGWNRFVQTPVGRVVAIPWYHLRNAWTVIRHPRYIYRLHYRKAQRWDRKEAWDGYAAFSQPKYRPGDTLKVKAWVCTSKGKPWDRPLDLLVAQSGKGRQIGKQRIAPTAPGVFVYQMVIDDSLDIDQPYYFEFTNPSPRKRGLFKQYEPEPGSVTGYVYLEDYQLDEVKYKFTQKKDVYVKDDSIVFHVEARDANGMPVSDGQYKLVVTTIATQLFYEQEVLVPDTLWQTEGAIDVTGDMDIRLPEQFLPSASFNVLTTLYATNSAGELQKLELRSSIDRRVSHLEAFIKGGWLQVDWKGKSSMPQKVLLQESYPNMGVQSDTIVLPYRAKVKPELNSYTIGAGQELIYLTLNNALLAGHHVTNQAFRSGDTVFFQLQNPQRIPVQYRIWSGKHECSTGVTADSVWTGTFVDREGLNYNIRYAFVWAGQDEQAEAKVPFYKNQLDVTLEQPENVQPGEQVQVKIRVRDKSKQPADGINITAGAYNALFGADKPYEIPGVKYKYKPDPRLYNPFEISVLNEGEYSLPLSDKWYKQLHLDTIPYYQIRQVYPFGSGKKPSQFVITTDISSNPLMKAGTTFLNQYDGILPDLPKPADSFYNQRPQFAPFVVEQFKSQPVYLIWVNNTLVYYHGNTDNQPYSFYGEYGYNTIKIRLRNSECILDSVYLEKGKKHTFSLYGNRWNCNPVQLAIPGETLRHAHIRWEPRPDSLTAFEQSYLQKSMLLLRDEPSAVTRYFWEYATNIHVLKTYQKPFHILGPFPPGSQINALAQNAFLTRFRFDPGFEYEVLSQRERLYASKWPLNLGHLPRKLPLKSVNDWAIGPQQIVRGAPQYNFNYTGTDKPGTGSLRVNFSQKDTMLKAIVLRLDTITGMYAPGSSNWYGLQPGIYQLAFYTHNSSIAEKTIQIRRDTLLCLDLSDITFRPVRANEMFDSLYQSVTQKDSKTSQNKSSIYYRPQAPGWEFGTVIQGTITDASGEGLIGASVKLMQGSEFIKGTVTDVEGNFRMEVLPGSYSIEISYTGFMTQRITGMHIPSGQISYVNPVLSESVDLQVVVVTGYSVRGLQNDLTSAQIIKLPTRSVNALMATTAGVVSIKGARSNGTEYYLDGIRVSGAIPPLQEVENISDQAQIRSKFRDYAYWQPHLSTDAQGEAVFQVTFPDDLTTWESYAIATAAKGRAGIGTTRTRAFKNLTAQLAVPRFAIAGDQFEAAGRVANHKSDSVTISTRFLLNDKVLGGKSARILQGTSEYMSLEIPAGLDTTTVTYEMTSGNASDGEQRKIPVLPIGTMETNGQFFALDNDTTFVITFPAGPHPLTVHAETNPLDLLLQDAEYLYRYPYGCNEQTASRLIALLSLKKIKSHLKRPFLYEKDVNACLKKLKNNQLPDGAWGWWANGAPNQWMTVYVSRALFAAQQAGYKAEGLDKSLASLRLYLPSMNTSDQCATLTLLRECQVNLDCTPYLLRLDSLKNISLTDRLNQLKLNQLCGKEVLKDSLQKYLNRTTFGGIYFGLGETGWYDRRAIQTLQAYDIAKSAGWSDITKGIERYWMQSRPVQRNTIETAKILEALLPGLLENGGAIRPVQLRINGEKSDVFPVSRQLDPAQGQLVQITKTGSSPLYLTAYQQWQNEAPTARSDLFEVHTQILLANGTSADNLRYGESATLEVRVQVKAAADYVMIEIPVPAGCSYGDKVQKGWPEVHREYFKEKTAIFCEHLPVGMYTFQVPLEPRFTGRFTLNPARVEQMYFPVFYGRNEVKKIKVER